MNRAGENDETRARAVTLRPFMSEETPFNPRDRRLCPDGSCVGLLDASGRCSECGRSFDPAVASATAIRDDGDGDDAAANRGDDAGDGAGAPASAGVAATAGVAGAGFDPNRRLCEDGACVGIVGADGACNVCGRVARS